MSRSNRPNNKSHSYLLVKAITVGVVDGDDDERGTVRGVELLEGRLPNGYLLATDLQHEIFEYTYYWSGH